MFRRDFIKWPKNEPIPQSIEEALALGWNVDGSGSEVSDDERVETGTATLKKKLGNVDLALDIPYRSEITYGQPSNHRAFIETINGCPVRELLAKRSRRSHRVN